MRNALLLAASLLAATAALAQEVVPGAEPGGDAASAPESAPPASPVAVLPEAEAQTSPPASPATLTMAPVGADAGRRAFDAPAHDAAAPTSSAPRARAVATAGEHPDFSRVVISGAAASVGQSGRTVTIALDHMKDADISAVRRAKRVASARLVPAGDGSRIVLDLGCDCRAKSMRLDDGRYVVDIYDTKPGQRVADAVAPSTPTPPARTEALAANAIAAPRADKLSVDEARKRMIALLQQAADDGIVSVRPGATELTPRAEAQKPTAPIETSAPGRPPAQAKEAAPAPKRGAYACLPDAAFAVDGRAVKDDPLGAIEAMQKQLADAEADAERPLTEKLALAYLAIGFGEEAIGMLERIEEDRSLYADMARVAAGKKPFADGLLMGADGCRGAHALWQAAALEPDDAISVLARAGDAIEALPPRLRGLLATRLAQTLLRAQAYKDARRFHTIAVKASGQSPELRFIDAKLLAQEGKNDASQGLLEDLTTSANQTAKDALGALSDKAVRAGDTSAQTAEDLGLLAKAARGTPEEGRAALREAIFWAENGSVEAGVFMLRDAARRDPALAAEAQSRARTAVATALASGDAKKRLAGLSAYIEDRDFFGGADADAALAELASETAVAFGVPNAALTVIKSAPAAARTPEAIARAALAAGAAETAIEAAAPFADQPKYADILVKANTKLGRGYAALAAAAALPDSAEKNALSADAAWRAGDYQSAARAFAKIDPASLSPERAERFAYAAYMAGDTAMPAAAEAVLRQAKSPALARLKALFAPKQGGAVVERGKAVVKGVDEDLKFMKEALGG